MLGTSASVRLRETSIKSLNGLSPHFLQVTRYGSLLAFARQMGVDAATAELEKLRDAAHGGEQRSRIAEAGTNMAASKEVGQDDEGREPKADGEPGDEDEKGRPKTVRRTRWAG